MITIEIDFDVYKAIETERRSFEETRNDALRRLLSLPPTPALAPPAVPDLANAWKGDGVRLPGGTKTRMIYSHRTHEGVIEKAAWMVEGQRFKSPSGAASGVARTKKGEPVKLDGWLYWEVLLPGGEQWTKLSELRRQARSRR